jgi:hypothetical protein
MAAVEPKGTTSLEDEAFPAKPAPDGGGYKLEDIEDGEWQTSTYQWAPSSITVSPYPVTSFSRW